MKKESFLDKLKKILRKIFYKQPKNPVAPQEPVNVASEQPVVPSSDQDVYTINTPEIKLEPQLNVVDANQNDKPADDRVLLGDEQPKNPEIVTHVSQFGDEKIEDLPQETLDIEGPKVTIGDPVEWKKPVEEPKENIEETPLQFGDPVQEPIQPAQEVQAPVTPSQEIQAPEQPLQFGDPVQEPTQPAQETQVPVEPIQEVQAPEAPLQFGDPEPIAPAEPTETPVEESKHDSKQDLWIEGPNDYGVIGGVVEDMPNPDSKEDDPRIYEEPIYKGSEVNQPAPAEQAPSVEPVVPAEPVIPEEPVIKTPAAPVDPILPVEPTVTEVPQAPLMFGDPEENIQTPNNEIQAPIQPSADPTILPDQGLHFPGIDPDFGEQGGPSVPGLK